MCLSSKIRFNLLTEPLIRVRIAGAEKGMSLPEVLEALGGDQEVVFVGLRPHQKHAWHAFLVQLTAMALHNAGEDHPSQTSERWNELLRGISNGEDEAWCLVIDDVSKPAFMQPPVPEESIDPRTWRSMATPGALDLLVTTKNHDVKARLITSPEADHWVFALVSLQTMQGYSGPKNFGIARMNSGSGSRPGVGFAENPGWNSRFVRDVPILINSRDDFVKEPWPYSNRGGHCLLWTLPWDGASALDLADCDPYFVEICRRIRLTRKGGEVLALRLPTPAARVAAKELKGVTGDPWTPVEIDATGAKALTVSASGFNYRLLQRLLFSGDYRHGVTWRQKEETGDLLLLASAMTRGQGKTEGLHQRQLRIPAPACGLMGTSEGRDRLSRLSRQQVEISDIVRRKVLHLALCQVTQGAPEEDLDFRDIRTERWLSNLDHGIDAIFFERLFAHLKMSVDAAADEWASELIDLALEQLEDALRSTPQPSIRHYRIESAAKGLFFGQARKHFPDLFEDSKQGEPNV